MLGKIIKIEELHDLKVSNISGAHSKGSQKGIVQMLNNLTGSSQVDGYLVETDLHKYHVLIENGQSCCEDWGYLSSEDNLEQYVGSELLEVALTNIELNTKILDEIRPDEDQVQFVNFYTDKGLFQLVVYNAHNGYYGHSIVITKDAEIILEEVL